MLTRRDLTVAAVAVFATSAIGAFAQTAEESIPHSMNFAWDNMKAAATPTGEKRAVMKARTATLDQLQVHVTTIGPGQRAHEPHRHPEEELMIVKDGTVESMQNGEKVRLGQGSVIFEASNELHGLRNVGDTPATYFVIKFWPPGLATQ